MKPCRFFSVLFFILIVFPIRAGEIHGKIQSERITDFLGFLVFLDNVPKIKWSERPPREHFVNQKKMAFIPRLSVIVAGDSVRFGNEDQETHIIHSSSEAKAFRRLTKPGEKSAPVLFEKAGEVHLLCDYHHQMSGHIIVLDNPWFAHSKQNGSFKIEDLPEGKYELKTWHEDFIEKQIRVELPSPSAVAEPVIVY